MNKTKLGMGHRLFVERIFKAGKSICKPEDRLQVICGIDNIDAHGRVATVRNTRTRTVLYMPVSNLAQFCKVIGYEGLEDFE